MKQTNKRVILSVLVIFTLFLSILSVSAANVLTLNTPAKADSISGTSYVLNASLDTNTLQYNTSTFYYQVSGIGANITITTVFNTSATEFNTTWNTASIIDDGNITVWVNVTNGTGTVAIDGSTNVQIDNGNPTATFAIDNFHDGYRAAKNDIFKLSLAADNSRGIYFCNTTFINTRDNSLVKITEMTVSGNACSNTTITPNGLLTAGESYLVRIEAIDDNGDKTNSSSRILKYLEDGKIITVNTQTGEPQGVSFGSIWDSISNAWKNFIQSIKNLLKI